jgi:Tol biopolymer transport system component
VPNRVLGPGEFGWSKDRNRALVVASEGASLVGDIYLIDIAERHTLRLTNDGRSACPSWSGDETEIAFFRDTFSLWVMSADGTRQRELMDADAFASRAR